MINTKRLTVANFFAQVLRDEINHVQVLNVSFTMFSVILVIRAKNFTCSIVSRCLIDIVHIFITDGLI